MRAAYEEYIADKSGVWSPASTRSEAQRLNSVLHLVDGDAPKLWEALKEYGSYSRTTLWTRVSAFWDWGIETKGFAEPNPYKKFREKNARAFRNAYQRNPCKQSYAEIMRKIVTIEDPVLRNTAKVLLVGGLRCCELWTIHDNNQYVIGKGSKKRKVYLPDPLGPIMTKSQYSALLRELKRFGLTPHKLRHARMTDMVEKGATIFELKKFAGWSNIAVAESYVNARDERLQSLAEQRRVDGIMAKLLEWAKQMLVKPLQKVAS
jgi:integrase